MINLQAGVQNFKILHSLGAQNFENPRPGGPEMRGAQKFYDTGKPLIKLIII